MKQLARRLRLIPGRLYHFLRVSLSDIRLDRALGRMALQDRPLLQEARRLDEMSGEQRGDPLVSVTIATYNRGQLLAERTLPSVLAQTYQNWEVVVVGDGCTDDTAERVAGLGDPRIRFHNLPERGDYPADPFKRWLVAGTAPINKALDLARGEWLAYLDDDDVFTPDHLEVLLRYAQERRYEFVYGRYVKESSPGVWQDGKEPRFPSGRPPFSSVLPHSSVLYRSYLQFKYDINAYRYNVGGDNLMWNRMARAGVRAGFLDRVVCSMPLRPGETAPSLTTIQAGSARKWSVWIRA